MKENCSQTMHRVNVNPVINPPVQSLYHSLHCTQDRVSAVFFPRVVTVDDVIAKVIYQNPNKQS